MVSLKALGRSPWVLRSASSAAALVFRFIRATTRYSLEPADLYQRLEGLGPIIATTWHGQHFMIQVARPSTRPFSVMISRHRDGELNALVAQKLGAGVIRGSGGVKEDMHRKGAFTASREVLRALQEGSSIVMTADIPKIARKASVGVVVLAQRSGCPIIPVAVVSRRRRDFMTWDRMSIGLPFTKGAIIVGDPIYVAEDADDQTREDKRLQLEAELNRIHALAYARVGRPHAAFSEQP